jgi:hypothetical protein
VTSDTTAWPPSTVESAEHGPPTVGVNGIAGRMWRTAHAARMAGGGGGAFTFVSFIY